MKPYLIVPSDSTVVSNLPHARTNIEVYLKNPITKEEGWEIEFLDVYSTKKLTKKEIRSILERYPNFDCIITI